MGEHVLVHQARAFSSLHLKKGPTLKAKPCRDPSVIERLSYSSRSACAGQTEREKRLLSMIARPLRGSGYSFPGSPRQQTFFPTHRGEKVDPVDSESFTCMGNPVQRLRRPSGEKLHGSPQVFFPFFLRWHSQDASPYHLTAVLPDKETAPP